MVGRYCVVSGPAGVRSAMLPNNAKMVPSIEAASDRTDPSAKPKFTVPEWSLPG